MVKSWLHGEAIPSNDFWLYHVVMAKKDEMTQQKTSHISPFGLRMQPELRAKVEGAATKAGRSMNAEITFMLEDYFNNVDKRKKFDADSIKIGAVVPSIEDLLRDSPAFMSASDYVKLENSRQLESFSIAETEDLDASKLFMTPDRTAALDAAMQMIKQTSEDVQSALVNLNQRTQNIMKLGALVNSLKDADKPLAEDAPTNDTPSD